MSQPHREYVLGTGDDELARLGLQHRLWADAAHAAWKLAGIGLGSRVLDVGCGPGYASCDLAELVGPHGAVVGLDESPGFITRVAEQAAARGLSQLRGQVADVQALEGLADFDVAYARWVLCFVPRPEAVVAGVARALRPGGRFVIHDYFNYTTMTMAPRRASHDKAVAATAASWKARGGDPDIAGRLPRLLAEVGLRVTHLAQHARVARGSDSMFAWPDTWWRTYAPKLVDMGLLEPTDCQALIADLDAIRGSETDYIVVPPVFEIVAEKLG